ncbi:hypothetical protein DH2020_018378 [Rehmannia glutinosa]|uniref:Phospholipid/glycerol acyltransferase domain-containing protein n=1 Tax=Rehmannia glutinosa TaxID=99300 RepID=A0ABR0WLH6_REHGL
MNQGFLKIDELPSVPENKERAIVLFKPISTTQVVHFHSDFSVPVDADIISGLITCATVNTEYEKRPREAELICLRNAKARFLEGRAVLPKFFLEDVGIESFQVLRRGKKMVAVSNLPRVMVESFLTDYLNIDFVVASDLKVFCGYFVGLMEERRDNSSQVADIITSKAIGITSLKQSFNCQWFSNCKISFQANLFGYSSHVYMAPYGFTLAIIRISIALTLPSSIVVPTMHFTGIQLRVFKSKSFNSSWKGIKDKKAKGTLYASNHKTLLDPVMISYSLGRTTPLTAVTYGISRVSEIISLVKTVRLTRDRNQDSELMRELLRQGDLVVCPEGTTSRETYLLRFSPLFAEITDNICPVAVDCYVSMFYGTTARGSKCLDPLVFFMNPELVIRFVF